jgi:hypothetical protein
MTPFRSIPTQLSPTLTEGLDGPGPGLEIRVFRRPKPHRWVLFVMFELTTEEAIRAAAGETMKLTSKGQTTEPICYDCEEPTGSAASSCPGL